MLGHRPLRRTCFGLVLIAGLSTPAAATAADNTVVGVGTGAVAGALVGGPIGAVVGAVAGGYIGANTGPRSRRARSADCRRSAGRPVATRARLAESAAPRVVAPAAPPRPPTSEIDTAPEATGSAGTRSGWRDPR